MADKKGVAQLINDNVADYPFRLLRLALDVHRVAAGMEDGPVKDGLVAWSLDGIRLGAAAVAASSRH